MKLYEWWIVREKLYCFFLLFSFQFISLHSFFCIFVYSLESVSFHLLRICLFFSSFFFFEFSCWLSSNDSLIWIFLAFVAFIEIVSLRLVLVIVIGIPGLLADKDFFTLLFKKRFRYLWYDPTQYWPFSYSYLLTTNFGRGCCLRGCWSILTYWWP